jgi:hydroxyacylglutathione hydrolase
MIFKQYYLGCLAHASYLIGDGQSRSAAIVDPQRDVDHYLADAASQGLRIEHVFLTHFHADFVAGHLELRDRTGAKIYLGARGAAEYAFTGMKDGDSVALGNVRLQVLETPGHTPESISILVFDGAEAMAPDSVLTGDTLFVGDVGRPDLRASLGWSAADLGAMLYDSLHTKLLALPDETKIYPAHGAGSLCGKSLGSENFSTIGIQRRLNYALQPMTKAEFLELVLADQPDAPPYFTYDAVLNTKERPTLEATLARTLQSMTLDQALRMQEQGAQVLDARDPGYFAAAHLAGSINIGLGGSYATWAGTVLDREKPIVIVAEPGREQEAAIRLGRIGFDHVAGYLAGGMAALEHRLDLVRHFDRLTPELLASELSSEDPPLVVDVRAPREWQQKRLAGCQLVPLNRLEERVEELPRERRLVMQCATGYRSSIAASLLERRGFDRLADLAGGIAAWQAAQLPVESAA